MKLLCIYHGNCADGFGAAWVVNRRCKLSRIGAEFHPGVYQDEPPDVTDRHVLLVDFSYKRPVLEEMGMSAKSVVILDHHKTAAEDLSGFREPVPFADWSDDTLKRVGADEPIAALFDMERSGAGIAWDFFFSGESRPMLINHIEDRDLWRFKLPRTREIQAALFSYQYDFRVWDELMSGSLNDLFLEGAAIERKHHKDVAELVEVVTRKMRIGGHVVPIANLPYTLTSDAGHLLCGEVQCPPGIGGPTTSRYPFAGCYWDTPDGRVFSLRSREDGIDVGEIAKEYGGGGHKHASGFRIPFDQLEQFKV